MIFTEEAKQLIVDFAINQTEMTKAANTRRGIPKRLDREERKLIAELLSAITGNVAKREDIDDVLKRIGC